MLFIVLYVVCTKHNDNNTNNNSNDDDNVDDAVVFVKQNSDRDEANDLKSFSINQY